MNTRNYGPDDPYWQTPGAGYPAELPEPTGKDVESAPWPGLMAVRRLVDENAALRAHIAALSAAAARMIRDADSVTRSHAVYALRDALDAADQNWRKPPAERGESG